ncbi:hypothetical protein llap_5610 [Limosa lapponica baueri]|uniref:Uncharacterized protein n=1 Tax=Limosa lapponica baueri TaxID=1758121 RepID=A0A2I0UDH8_LIMLA|nr:hypothetical protein llap_5610 [Limosa lapponica baueri]
MMKTVVRQAVPLQPMEVNGGADIYLQPVEVPKGGCGGAHGDPTLEQVPGRTCEPVERGAHAGAEQVAQRDGTFLLETLGTPFDNSPGESDLTYSE